MATLNLKNGTRPAVWKVLRETIKADPAYDQAQIGLSFYDGDPDGLADLDTFPSGVMQFFPACGNMSWFDERSQSGALVVQVEARIRSLDCEDIFNLQEALETTLSTVDSPQFALQAGLVNAGAVTGLVLFQQPLRVQSAGKAGTDGLFRLVGQFVVEVLRPLN